MKNDISEEQMKILLDWLDESIYKQPSKDFYSKEDPNENPNTKKYSSLEEMEEDNVPF